MVGDTRGKWVRDRVVSLAPGNGCRRPGYFNSMSMVFFPLLTV